MLYVVEVKHLCGNQWWPVLDFPGIVGVSLTSEEAEMAAKKMLESVEYYTPGTGVTYRVAIYRRAEKTKSE